MQLGKPVRDTNTESYFICLFWGQSLSTLSHDVKVLRTPASLRKCSVDATAMLVGIYHRAVANIVR